MDRDGVLVKTNDGNYVFSVAGWAIASTDEMWVSKPNNDGIIRSLLSKSNCDELFEGIDYTKVDVTIKVDNHGIILLDKKSEYTVAEKIKSVFDDYMRDKWELMQIKSFIKEYESKLGKMRLRAKHLEEQIFLFEEMKQQKINFNEDEQ